MCTRRRFWQGTGLFGTGLFQRVISGKNSAEALRIENYSFRQYPILARSVRKGGTPRRIPLGIPAKSESAPNGLARRVSIKHLLPPATEWYRCCSGTQQEGRKWLFILKLLARTSISSKSPRVNTSRKWFLLSPLKE